MSSPKRDPIVGQFVKEIKGHLQRVQCMDVVGENVWSGSSHGTILVHNGTTGEYVSKLQAPGKALEEDYIVCLKAVNVHYVWCGASDGTINVFSADSGECKAQLLGHTGSVNCLALSRGAVWSGSGDKSVRCWDADTGKLLKILTGHTNWVRCLLIFEGRVWSGSDDASIRVWDEQSGQLLQDVRGHTGGVLSLVLVGRRQSGRQVWSGSADKSIHVWDAYNSAYIKDLRGHNGWVTGLIYEGGYVWSGSSDKSIRIWNPTTGNCIKILQGHAGWVWCLLAVGNHVWSGSGDRTIRLWLSDPLRAEYDLSPGTARAISRDTGVQGSPAATASMGFATSPHLSPIQSRVQPLGSDRGASTAASSLHNEPAAAALGGGAGGLGSVAASSESRRLRELEARHKQETEGLRNEIKAQMERTLDVQRSRAELASEFDRGSSVGGHSSRQQPQQPLSGGHGADESSRSMMMDLDGGGGPARHLADLDPGASRRLREDLEGELRNIHKALEEELAYSLQNNAFNDPAIQVDEQEPLNEYRKSYEQQALRLNAQVQEELNKRSDALDAALRERAKYGDFPPKNVPSLSQMLRDLRAMLDYMEADRQLFRRRLALECQARARFEFEVEQLQQRLGKVSRREAARVQTEVDDNALHLMDTLAQTERQLEQEQGRTAQLQQELQAQRDQAGQLETSMQQRLDEMRETFQQNVRDTQRRLEAELEATKRIHERQLENEVKLRDQLQSRTDSLLQQMEQQHGFRDDQQRELQLQLNQTELRLTEESRLKHDLEQQNAALQRQVGTLQDELAQLRKALDIEAVEAAQTRQQYEDGMRDVKALFELLRQADGRALTRSERDAVDELFRAYTQRAFPFRRGDDFLQTTADELRSLRAALGEAQAQREAAERSKAELLQRLDAVHGDDPENNNRLLSELFEAKREAEERLERARTALKVETRNRNELEEECRKLQMRLEKAKRELEAETKSSVATRHRLEQEIAAWKDQMSAEMGKALKRLEEEDIVRRQLQHENDAFVDEVAEFKRQMRQLQSECKTKVDAERDERRSVAEQHRLAQLDIDDLRERLSDEQKARAELERHREAELEEFKRMFDSETQNSIQRLAEEELKRSQFEQQANQYRLDLDRMQREWQAEADELRRKLDTESRQRMSLEVAKRDLHELLEDTRKAVRTEANALSDEREAHRLVLVELAQCKRGLEKFEELKAENEARLRRISELQESARVGQQSHQDELQKLEKKYDLLRAKYEMEIKLKDDVAELKRRLERELELSESTSSDESVRRKAIESELWRVNMELAEARRRLEDAGEQAEKRQEQEQQVRRVLQETNDKLHAELQLLRSAADDRLRQQRLLDEANKKLAQQTEEQRLIFDERMEQMNQMLQDEKKQRQELLEELEALKTEYNQLRDQFDEARSKYSLELSKRQLERELETKKRTIERDLKRRSSMSEGLAGTRSYGDLSGRPDFSVPFAPASSSAWPPSAAASSLSQPQHDDPQQPDVPSAAAAAAVGGHQDDGQQQQPLQGASSSAAAASRGPSPPAKRAREELELSNDLLRKELEETRRQVEEQRLLREREWLEIQQQQQQPQYPRRPSPPRGRRSDHFQRSQQQPEVSFDELDYDYDFRPAASAPPAYGSRSGLARSPRRADDFRDNKAARSAYDRRPQDDDQELLDIGALSRPTRSVEFSTAAAAARSPSSAKRTVPMFPPSVAAPSLRSPGLYLDLESSRRQVETELEESRRRIAQLKGKDRQKF